MPKKSTIFVALLRSVNVGGTGKLLMQDLTAMCTQAGFTRIRTYIASGNVLFESSLNEPQIKKRLEAAVAAHAGRPIAVLVRTAAEMAAIAAANPFTKDAPNRTVAIFLDERPPADTQARTTGRKNESIALGAREIFVAYGDGMAASRLRIPAAEKGTARNMNTVRKLAELAAAHAKS